MVDLESQKPAPGESVTSPTSPRSPLGRLSWKPGQRQPLRVNSASLGRKSHDDGGSSSSSNHNNSASASPSSPTSPTGATIFRTLDRPDLQMMESYAVGGAGAGSGILSPGRRESGSALFKTPALRMQRSRSQRRSTADDRIDKAKRRSISRPRPKTESGLDGEAGLAAPLDEEDAETASAAAVAIADGVDEEQPVAMTSMMGTGTAGTTSTTFVNPFSKQRLSELHAKHPHLKSLPRPLLPIVAFPGQGTGKMSEFDQAAPIWARQPYKLLYFAYFGLSVGLVFLPWFALVSLFPSKRERPSWTWKKSTLVKLYRHGTRLTFRTHTALSRDLTKEVPHSKTVRAKFVWVNALPDDLVRGELQRGLAVQGLETVRTCGFWYGERDGGGGVGQRAAPGEKVVYHLHGGAYWIGTAHEKDVTAAVNVQILKALDAIYSQRMPGGKHGSKDGEGNGAGPLPSPHPPRGGPGGGSGGVCKRAFSLDYRLCVPGRPEVGSYPAPLADAMAGYRYLVEECDFAPDNIIVAGDSAGGNLALALCRYLRDERLAGMPGAMLLLSPWTDTSRSHSGPTSAPNKLSTVYLNRTSDIIAPSLAFRNTAVSALLGRMPARETYKNPYLSANSLQLPANDGGAGPAWGFDGFPRRIYICTGTAEINHDQHVTLAYRLAGGSRLRVPVHAGDMCHKEADPYEMAARLQYPRPDDHEVTLWPSAQNTPAGMPLAPPSNGWDEVHRPTSSTHGQSSGAGPKKGDKSPINGQQGQVDAMNEHHGNADTKDQKRSTTVAATTTAIVGTARDATLGVLNDVGRRLKSADGYLPTVGNGSRSQHTSSKNSSNLNVVSEQRTPLPAQPEQPYYEAGEGPNTTQVKERDTATGAHATHKKAQQGEEKRVRDEEKAEAEAEAGATADLKKNGKTLAETHVKSRSGSSSVGEAEVERVVHTVPTVEDGEPTYFELGGEDRTVVLDECIDAIHDYTLFDWFEPERGRTWSRIAQWIDDEV